MSNNERALASSPTYMAAKWIVVAVLIVAGVYGNSHFANDYSGFLRALVLLPMGALAVFVALQTAQGATFLQLVKESRAEIRRVVWPSRQETNQTTLIVVAVVLVMALILWGLDSSFNWLISKIIA